MPAYLLSIAEITRFDANLKKYVDSAAELAAKHGGEYVVRGKPVEVTEGELFKSRSAIVLRFPDMASLRAFYQGEEYQQKLKPLREGTGNYEIAIWEGA
jgi:uncharacterized protein (DUF1330 family)